ncbi:MAG TPA: hypothetical protein VJI75_06705 [Candidatus Nanoarchaeia archaeon]|nr:hypothetical protein [Candidatus Nanoarchaeia archaeon]
MSFNKKGSAEQILMYVVGALIAVMILIFGYKAIANISSSSQKADLAKFKNDLSDSIDRTASYGKVDVIELRVPGEYSKLCFIDRDNAVVSGVLDPKVASLVTEFSLAGEVAKSSDNVFLANLEGTIDPFSVPLFEVVDKFPNNNDNPYSDAALCVQVRSGTVRFRLVGKGDKTRIECTDAELCGGVAPSSS